MNVHVLVLTAFAGPRPPGLQACHFPDGTKSNNALANLRWDTPASNCQDKVAQGVAPVGERHGMFGAAHMAGERNASAKLNGESVARIRRLRSDGWTQRAIAAEFGVHQTHVGRILRNVVWPPKPHAPGYWQRRKHAGEP
jgi:hypothetical protein